MHAGALHCKVYIVDDSSVQRAHAASLCQELGLDVIALASDGLEALLALKSGAVKPDLLLLDLEMPGLDGIGLLHELVRLKLPMRVVVMSTRENPLLAAVEQMGKESALQILAALQKPVSARRLQEVLEARAVAPATEEIRPDFSAAEFSAALAGGQIRMRYLPRVHLGNGLIQGLDVQPCWQHPEHGLLLARQFMPLLPDSIRDDDLYRFLLDTVLQRAQHWLQRGLKLGIVLRLPARLFRQRLFANLLQERLEQFGLHPEMLIIKLKDWDPAQDGASIAGILGQLRLMGFGIAISDRGNGFAWLDELGSVPFNEFHLDEAFLLRADSRALTRIILESMIQLAHRLELKTLGPGLATPERWQQLLALGCDYATGPLISPLLDGDDVVGWMRENSERLRHLAQEAKHGSHVPAG
ncbi:EAL domain-containing response regulator [Chitinilyticum aquatile]|uniref:EAL domain-containing response regulator n=1 Tax=Chitinilyticum aquatile TaxID=362520 RepID=UPI00041348B6|nr:EAL domain-containing protein [Chitinilyticum aquatile]